MADGDGKLLFKLPVWVYTINGASYEYLELTQEQLDQMKRDNQFTLYGTGQDAQIPLFPGAPDSIVGSGDPVAVMLAAQQGRGN
jgi:hypothetical protein